MVSELAELIEELAAEISIWNESAGRPAESGDADLARLVTEDSGSLELLFFPRLRDELRIRLRHSPKLVRFRGLRVCVKQLAGARRWSSRCERLQDQIVAYLRGCLTAETAQNECALVVE